jgi:DNA-binding IscR family transcriptional regulator
VTACSTDAESCGQYAKCSVRDPLWRIKDRIVSALADCTLQEIATDSLAEPPMPMAFNTGRNTAKL